MIKRLFHCFFALFLCLAIGTSYAHPQDTAKKGGAAKPAAAKPAYHYTKTPTDTAQANALKAQMDPAQLNDKSLNGQYQYLLSKTYHYQQPLLAALWKNAMDTLNRDRRSLKDAEAKLSAQNQVVSSLKADVTSKDQSLSASNEKVDSISVFGIMMSKSTYNLVMFGLVIILALALVIVIGTTTKYKLEAKHRINLYEEIDEEFKAFKAKANEKEIKLARELQTERNKLDELLGRG